MKIIIRADGGKNIGMGHIMRTSVLADKLKDFADVVYVCSRENAFQSGVDFIINKGYKVIRINRDNIINELVNIQGDCLITDSYDVNEKYFDETKKRFSVTGYIDDMSKYRFNVDFIINQNIYAEELNYKVPDYAKLFLGTKFLLLREEFLDLPKKHICKNVKDIMVTLGGSDNNNLTKKIIILLNEAYPNINLHVVIGPSFTYQTELQNIESDRVKLYYNPKMSEIMRNCDLVISACGSTLYELAACGTPTIGIVVADNQELVAKKLDKMQIIKYCKNIDDIPNHIKLLDYQKRVIISEIGQKLIDGLGAIRLANEIKNIISYRNKQMNIQ